MEELIKDPRAIGDLEGFPSMIIDAMLDEQAYQGNPRDVTVFQECSDCGKVHGGFDWGMTKDGQVFWAEIIYDRNFSTFFLKLL